MSTTPGEIHWMLKRADGRDVWLGFVRCQRSSGAYIIGGPTGSHMTGRGESWRTKLKALKKEGYLAGGLPRVPPRMDNIDQEILKGIQTGRI